MCTRSSRAPQGHCDPPCLHRGMKVGGRETEPQAERNRNQKMMRSQAPGAGGGVHFKSVGSGAEDLHFWALLLLPPTVEAAWPKEPRAGACMPWRWETWALHIRPFPVWRSGDRRVFILSPALPSSLILRLPDSAHEVWEVGLEKGSRHREHPRCPGSTCGTELSHPRLCTQRGLLLS